VVQPPTYQAEHGYKWLITLKTAADAVRAFRIFPLIFIRLNLSPSSFSKLTYHFTPFILFLPHHWPAFSLSPGLSQFDHVFSSVDYLDYVERRRQILISCCGRAALLAGGLLWRLALEHLGEESASFGPSSAVLEHGLGFVCTMENQVFGDDELTHDEIAVICGLYYQCTGMLVF